MFKFTRGAQVSELMLLIKFEKTRAGGTGNMAQEKNVAWKNWNTRESSGSLDCKICSHHLLVALHSAN